jgi:hypothetical protein
VELRGLDPRAFLQKQFVKCLFSWRLRRTICHTSGYILYQRSADNACSFRWAVLMTTVMVGPGFPR